jgi:hypothetical protein
MLRFSIRRWAAWAPGLTSAGAWRAWATSPTAPRGEEAPALTSLPPNTRRRLDRVGRLVLEVGLEVQGERRGTPLVFATRYGEAARTDGLLTQLCSEGAMSPAGFALSVHNAVAGQYAIARADVAPVTAIAAGRFTLEAGVVEAVTQLADGHDEVVLVMSDVSLPSRYAPWADDAAADYAFAWAVARGDALSLEPVGPGPRTPGPLPHALDVLRFTLSDDAALTACDETAGWSWRRHG